MKSIDVADDISKGAASKAPVSAETMVARFKGPKVAGEGGVIYDLVPRKLQDALPAEDCLEVC
jgi:hypothetical protein